jgi:PilX N-terminal
MTSQHMPKALEGGATQLVPGSSTPQPCWGRGGIPRPEHGSECRTRDIRRRADGVVLVVVLLLTLLMSALGAALTLVTSSETKIAANFRSSHEARYAASGAAERAVVDMAASADWSRLLDGTVRSTFIDGLPSGARTLPDGSTLDLGELVNLANCQKTTMCGGAEMDAVTTDRPWGVNNPRWRLFAYGWFRDVLPAGAIDSAYYTVVLVGDDPSETDGDPSRDGVPPSLGAGVVELRSQAFGPRGVRRTINLTVGRTSSGVPRVMSWREIR